MKKTVFTGAAVAIITPMYPDGSVNYEELAKLDITVHRSLNTKRKKHD